MAAQLISRGEALEELEKFGIKGNDVYLIDIIQITLSLKSLIAIFVK